LVRAVINSEKHIVPRSLFTIDAGSVQTFDIAIGENDRTASAHVRVGSLVKAVYVEMWYLASGSQPIVQTSTIEKLNSGLTAVTQPQMANLNDYDNKKNILYTTQGIVGDANTNPSPLLRQWIPIPKGKQRMGQGDRIVLNIMTLGEAQNDLEVCGIYIFKENF